MAYTEATLVSKRTRGNTSRSTRVRRFSEIRETKRRRLPGIAITSDSSRKAEKETVAAAPVLS